MATKRIWNWIWLTLAVIPCLGYAQLNPIRASLRPLATSTPAPPRIPRQRQDVPRGMETDPYWHREVFGSRGEYQLEWKVDWASERVNFNVTVATLGYVALGLAKHNKMEGADIVIGGVTSRGQSYFSDRHAIGNQQPVIDPKQDWTLHTARENGSHTFLSFSRPFETCDDHDVVINDDVLYVLWAFGERDNLTEYHYQNRGTYLVYLKDPDLTPQVIHEANRDVNGTPTGRPVLVDRGGEVKVWEIRETFRIPPKRTTYWCRLHKFAPEKPGKHHIIGYNIRIDPLETMHHMLLYRCNPPLNVNPALVYGPFLGSPGQECYSLSDLLGPMPTQFCTDLVLGHAIGGLPTFFPDHVGIPIGDRNPEEFFMLQVHYDNENAQANITTRIQMDVYYTENPRENDASVLSLGHHIPGAPSILLPPGQQNHRFYGHCAPSCTRKMFPPEGIKIAGALLHAHMAGRKVRIQHFRNGRELPWIANDDNYKWQHQPLRILRNDITVLPGDQVSVQCYYDTTQANMTTVGGYAIYQEMCKTFMLYYSKMDQYPVCRSEIMSKDYMTKYLAGLLNVTWDQPRLEFAATFPLHLTGMTLSNISDSGYVNWDIRLRTELERDHIIHPQQTVCPSITEAAVGQVLDTIGLEIGPPPEYVSFPVEAKEYVPPQRCTLGG